MAIAAQTALILFAGSAAIAAAGPDNALAIMQKAATNTAAATDARRQYVYKQKVGASLLHTDGKVARKETREYTVVPQATTTEKALVSFSGEYRKGKRMAPYSKPGVKDAGDDSDRENIQSLVDELVNAKDTRDGIPHDLFPLRGDDLRFYKFSLKGETNVRGRRTWEISFEPVELKDVCIRVGTVLHISIGTGPSDTESTPGTTPDTPCHQWKGEVWIDAEDYQPVRIATETAKGVPWGVRVFMGINVRQFGFSIDYQRVAENVWFPHTYGTEFGIEVLWGYRRTMTLSMENTDFRKTDTDSTIHYDPPQP